MSLAIRHGRQAYQHFHSITSRWADNDAYGHVNNVVYYQWFDTVANEFLIRHRQLDLAHGPVMGLVIESGCTYFAPVAFPDQVTAGLRVTSLGNSSVRYEIGIFCGDALSPAAQGYFVHVYVDRVSRKPTTLPAPLRALLQSILTENERHD